MYKSSYVKVVLGLVCLLFYANSAQAKDVVSGNFKINDDSAEINHVYADKGEHDIMLVFTDVAVPQDSIPFGVLEIAMEGKLRGIVITIDPKTKQLDKNGYNVLYDKAWEGQLGTIGNGVLTIEKLDDNMIEGTLKTPGPNTYTDSFEEKDYVYTYNIKFKAKLMSRSL